jgi:hypothetical protein
MAPGDLLAQLDDLCAKFTAIYLVDSTWARAQAAQRALGHTMPVTIDWQTSAIAITAALLTTLTRLCRPLDTSTVLIVGRDHHPEIAALAVAAARSPTSPGLSLLLIAPAKRGPGVSYELSPRWHRSALPTPLFCARTRHTDAAVACPAAGGPPCAPAIPRANATNYWRGHPVRQRSPEPRDRGGHPVRELEVQVVLAAGEGE